MRKRLVAQPAQDIEAVTAWHSQIQQQQMWKGMLAAVSELSFTSQIRDGLVPVHGMAHQPEVLELLKRKFEQ